MAKKSQQVKAVGKAAGVNQGLLDDAVRHAVALERYKAGEVAGVARALDREIVPALVALAEKKLSKNAGSWSARQVGQAAAAANELMRASLRQVGEKSAKNMGSLAVSEARWQAATLGANVPLGIDFKTPSPDLLVQLVGERPMGAAVMSTWWSKLGADAGEAVSKQIRIGTASGESVQQIVARLVGDPEAGKAFQGSMAKVRRDMEAVVRTSINHASTQAKEETFRANRDVLKGVQMVATLDAATTEICMAMDGKVFPVDEGPRPPFHFNCRTVPVPVTKSFSELMAEHGHKSDFGAKLDGATPGERASMNGQVPATGDFGQWLAGQGPETQDDVLGPARAELFRAGKVPVDRFVDPTGKKLTLQQLDQLVDQAGGKLPSYSPDQVSGLSSNGPKPSLMKPAAPKPTVPAASPSLGSGVATDPSAAALAQEAKPVAPPKPKPAKAKSVPIKPLETQLVPSQVAAPTAPMAVKAEVKAAAIEANKGSVEAAQKLALIADANPGALQSPLAVKADLKDALERVGAQVPKMEHPDLRVGFTTPDGKPLPPEVQEFIKSGSPASVDAARRFAKPEMPEYEAALRAWTDNLKSNPDEFDSLKHYTGKGFYPTRQRLVFGNVEGSRVDNDIRNINAAMARAPSAEQTVYRGLKMNYATEAATMAQFDRGYVTFTSYTSASKSERIANNFSGGLVLEIKSKSGVDIEAVAKYEFEREVLLRPGTTYRVVKKSKIKVKGKNAWKVELEEV